MASPKACFLYNMGHVPLKMIVGHTVMIYSNDGVFCFYRFFLLWPLLDRVALQKYRKNRNRNAGWDDLASAGL